MRVKSITVSRLFGKDLLHTSKVENIQLKNLSLKNKVLFLLGMPLKDITVNFGCKRFNFRGFDLQIKIKK